MRIQLICKDELINALQQQIENIKASPIDKVILQNSLELARSPRVENQILAKESAWDTNTQAKSPNTTMQKQYKNMNVPGIYIEKTYNEESRDDELSDHFSPNVKRLTECMPSPSGDASISAKESFSMVV